MPPAWPACDHRILNILWNFCAVSWRTNPLCECAAQQPLQAPYDHGSSALKICADRASWTRVDVAIRLRPAWAP